MPRAYDINGQNNPNYRTGLATSGQRTSLYSSWQNMKQRCTNPKNPKFYRYGARGITICQEWFHIKSFASWAFSAGWSPGLQIDRIDNDGNYEPGNCRWVSASANAKRKSTTKLTPVDVADIRTLIDKGMTDNFISEQYGVVSATIWFIRKNITHKA